MSDIPELSSTAIALMSVAWRDGREDVDFRGHVAQLGREEGLPALDLSALRTIVDEAMTRFADDRSASDAWLSSRLHVALRLTRREAAVRGFWRYLAVVHVPDYVRWRFPASVNKEGNRTPTPTERFDGDSPKHALGRLWWGAELFRDGADYSPVALAFAVQDLMNNLFKMDICHHRPTAQAAVSALAQTTRPEQKGDLANALSKAANLAATTLMIDMLAPDEPLDAAGRHEWMCEDIDVLRIIEKVPDGPNDPRVPVASVVALTNRFLELLDEAPVRSRSK